MSPLAFLVRVLPLYLLSLALTAIGAMPLGTRVPSGWLAPLAIAALLTFAALVTFRHTRAWPTILLLAFAATAGILVRRMLPGIVAQWPCALAAGLGMPLFWVPAGWWAGARLRVAAWTTWVAAWVYILGWIAWQLLAQGAVMQFYWGIAGMLVFSVLAVTWGSTLPGRDPRQPEGSVAAELYLIGLNLAVAALGIASS